MARTRGASSQPEGRRRLTTSVRRGDRGASSSAPPVAADAVDIGGIAPRIGGGEAAEVVGFPGGPSDMSLLVSYNHHVALRLWEGELRLCYKFLYSVCV